MPTDPFAPNRYVVRQKVFKIFGEAFHIYDQTQQQVLFYSKLKAFKLKEDIRVWTGEDMTRQVLTIQARSIIDFGATYDVVDAVTHERLGSLRRKGLKSLLRDEWLIFDENDEEVGKIQEDSTGLAILRRLIDFASLLLPQGFTVTYANQPVAQFKQNFNPFVKKLVLDFTPDPEGLLDRRLGIAAAVLLCAIEGRQS